MTRDDVLKLVVNHARYSGENSEGNPVYTLSHNGKFYTCTNFSLHYITMSQIDCLVEQVLGNTPDSVEVN